LLFGSLMAGTLVLVKEDSVIQRGVPKFLDKGFSRRLDLDDLGNKNTFFEQLGGPVGVLEVSGAFYLWGTLTKSEGIKNVALLAPEAYVVNGILVLGIKEVVGRSRPVSVRNYDSAHFRPFSGQASFPSGHTSTAFAVATVVSGQCQSPWVSAVGYGLASAVGAGRVIQNQHWTSDVLAGAILGYGSGKLVLNWNAKHNWSLGLSNDGKGFLISRMF